MPIDSLHPTYSENSPKWKRCRDACDGEDAVKSGGDSYLPRLTGDDTTHYDAYKNRALYFNASGRTKSAFSSMAFHKTPDLKCSDQQLLDDAALDGRTMITYARAVLDEVLEVGRAGTLVDWSESEERPYFALYEAESIVDWNVRRFGGRSVLQRVVLCELVPEDSIPDALTPTATDDSESSDSENLIIQFRELIILGGSYNVRLWRKTKVKDKTPEWAVVGELIPSRRGIPLPYIPFVFHGPKGSTVEIDRPPLEDIVVVNLSHYRSSADLEHGRHYTALPTPWVTGVEAKGDLTIGPSKAWQIESENAKVGMLEFTGQGLGALEKAMNEKERLMAVLGSRMLEAPKREVETAEAMQIRAMADGTSLTLIVHAVSEGITDAMAFAGAWRGGPQANLSAIKASLKFQINTDFLTRKMSADELRAVVASWQGGLMTRDSALWNLQHGGVLNPARTLEEEAMLLDSEAPPLIRKQLPVT